MTNVGFLLSSCFPNDYPGGKNYMLNLFEAASQNKFEKLNFIFFIGNKTSTSYKQEFEKYGMVIRDTLFDRWSLSWFFYKIIYKLFNTHFLLNILLKKYKIDILSHSDIYGERLPYKTINWLPDFQILHLPKLWTKESLLYEKKRFYNRLLYSDVVLFSSFDGQKDGISLYPDVKRKSIVIRPAYNIGDNIYINPNQQLKELTTKYKIPEKYFYLPNQFWVHKNHMVVFQALSMLKSKGINALVICSGLMDGADSQERGHPDYMKSIHNFIAENNLENNITLLGLIDYKDVLKLGRNSISIINPSFFEGWSSTVEEAKSIGKNVILSKLEIHLEQDPLGAVFFNPKDHKELAKILEEKWINNNGGPDYDLENNAKLNIGIRTKSFGKEYLTLIQKVSGN